MHCFVVASSEAGLMRLGGASGEYNLIEFRVCFGILCFSCVFSSIFSFANCVKHELKRLKGGSTSMEARRGAV